MFSPKLKYEIAEKVQRILQETNHSDLPKGEINFLLHIDGATGMSWANIRNNSQRSLDLVGIPASLIRNTSV